MKIIIINFTKVVLGTLMMFCISSTFVSCRIDGFLVAVDNTGADTIFASNRTDQKPLNVVYFIPTDFVSAYQTNDSTIKSNVSVATLFAQLWYKKQMELGGYSDKTFALFTRNSNTEVKVIPIYASKASVEYANSDQVRAETKAYLDSHPEEKGGEHTLIFHDAGAGFPMNAANRMGVVSSTDGFTMVNTGKTLDGLQLFNSSAYSGLLHELGHSLNAPHIAHRASNLPNMTIMGDWGTQHYNTHPNEVLIETSSLAIFDVSEAFNKSNNGINYYAVRPNIKLIDYKIKKDSTIQATKASFTFTSDIPPKYLYIGMDAEPSGSGVNNYDEVAFTAKVTPTGNTNEYKAELEMPYSEFFNDFYGYNVKNTKTDCNIVLSVNILTENGFREIPLAYSFTIPSVSQPEPDNTINKTYIDRSAWSITANTTSPLDPLGRSAEKMLDGDPLTSWFSYFPTVSAVATPHIINVDMGKENTFKGISIISEQFTPKHILVQTSSDNITFTTASDYTQAVQSSNINVLFDSYKLARYIKIAVDRVYTSNGKENLIIKELNLIAN